MSLPRQRQPPPQPAPRPAAPFERQAARPLPDSLTFPEAQDRGDPPVRLAHHPLRFRRETHQAGRLSVYTQTDRLT